MELHQGLTPQYPRARGMGNVLDDKFPIKKHFHGFLQCRVDVFFGRLVGLQTRLSNVLLSDVQPFGSFRNCWRAG
jgi:hypothetical protein